MTLSCAVEAPAGAAPAPGPAPPAAVPDVPQTLTGLTIVVTGSVPGYSRDGATDCAGQSLALLAPTQAVQRLIAGDVEFHADISEGDEVAARLVSVEARRG